MCDKGWKALRCHLLSPGAEEAPVPQGDKKASLRSVTRGWGLRCHLLSHVIGSNSTKESLGRWGGKAGRQGGREVESWIAGQIGNKIRIQFSFKLFCQVIFLSDPNPIIVLLNFGFVTCCCCSVHGFVKVVSLICQTCFFWPFSKQNQDFKDFWSICSEQKVLNESTYSMPRLLMCLLQCFFYLKMKMMQCLSDWAPAQGIRTIRGANIPTNPYNLPHTLIIFKIYFFCFVFSLQISKLSKIFCLSRIFRVLVWFNMTLKFFWIVDFKIICWGDSSQCSKTKPRAMSDLQLSGLKQRFLKWSNFVFLDALASLKTMFKIKWLIK